jgi:hypothetical protein
VAAKRKHGDDGEVAGAEDSRVVDEKEAGQEEADGGKARKLEAVSRSGARWFMKLNAEKGQVKERAQHRKSFAMSSGGVTPKEF